MPGPEGPKHYLSSRDSRSNDFARDLRQTGKKSLPEFEKLLKGQHCPETKTKMAKAKSKATLVAADGTDGMAPVKDRRFASGEWPIRFEVPKNQARSWLKYLQAELQARGRNSTGLSQMEAQENSGSLNVNTGTSDKPQFSVVWEWERGRSMRVRSRSTGTPELPLAEARTLFEQGTKNAGLRLSITSIGAGSLNTGVCLGAESSGSMTATAWAAVPPIRIAAFGASDHHRRRDSECYFGNERVRGL